MADKNGAPGPDKRFTNDESPAPSVLKTISRAAVGEHRILSILLAIGLLYTLYFARNFLFPVLIALLLFLVLEPIVEYLRRWKVPRGFAAAIVITFLVILIAGAFYQLASPAVDWINRGPQIRWKIQHKLRNFKKSIKEARETTQEIEQVTHPETEKKDKVVVKGLSLADRILAQTQSTLAYTAIVLVLIYFLLAGGDKTLKRFALVFGGKEGEGVYTELAGTVQREISRYLRTIGLINLGLGALTASAMALLGMPTPLLWGALACRSKFHTLPWGRHDLLCDCCCLVADLHLLASNHTAPGCLFQFHRSGGPIYHSHDSWQALYYRPGVVVSDAPAVWLVVGDSRRLISRSCTHNISDHRFERRSPQKAKSLV